MKKKLTNSLIYLLLVAAGISIIASSCTKEAAPAAKASANPIANAITPDSAKGGTVLTLTGTGLGGITTVVFDNGNVPYQINPVFNTATALVFRVPDTANGGKQNIVFTNALGKQFKVPIKVIALPLVNAVSEYDYTDGTQITLTGNNLGDVVSAVLKGSTESATIVSKSKHTLVISMPVNSQVAGAPLVITNSTGPTTTTQIFENLNKAAYQVFTDNFGPGVSGQAWGTWGVSTTVAKTGTSSFFVNYPQGNWWIGGWNFSPSLANNYSYLSMWIKGGVQDESLNFISAQGEGGYGNSDQTVVLAVPANVWTYYKIAVSQTDMFLNGQTTSNFGFYIRGPNNVSETIYFDDVILTNQ